MDGWHGDDGLEKTVPESGTLAAGDDGDNFHPVAGRNRHPGKILRQERGPVVFHDDGFKSSRSRETEQGSASSYGAPFSIISFWAAMTEATVPQQEKKSRIIPWGWRKKDSGASWKKEKLASRTGLEPVLPA